MASKKKNHHDEHVDESWLIPYADMLTLLLALFVILFAISQVDATKYEQLRVALSESMGGQGVLEEMSPVQVDPATPSTSSSAADVWVELQELKEELDQYIEAEGLGNRLSADITPDGLLITINDHILFASGSANLKPSAETLALTLADFLATDPPWHIQISGHTDNRPIHTAEFASNWELSSARALNVMNIFLQNPEIRAKQLSIAGYGEYQPVASNDTAEGRERNRRVEVLILPRHYHHSETTTSNDTAN
ncbi:OmpA family protein [Halalkalibacterium ligniniphilum]|uniref:OmpA family protein n=1 Tax=Halalkalibacterium ligniniphilum TaxID=1134413 RepID=UPI00034A4984|nr:flagellar motor protein MotB [Halalkalibacterium ligniniphilum]